MLNNSTSLEKFSADSASELAALIRHWQQNAASRCFVGRGNAPPVTVEFFSKSVQDRFIARVPPSINGGFLVAKSPRRNNHTE
jgi:hypothetical protein